MQTSKTAIFMLYYRYQSPAQMSYLCLTDDLSETHIVPLQKKIDEEAVFKFWGTMWANRQVCEI